MGELIGAREAASRLRISVSSLYAYVSRGAVRRIPGPDGRTSLYDTDEIAALAARSRPRTRRRAASSIDLLVSSRVSTVTDGVVRYRGIELADLIRQQLPFEIVAERLWQTPESLSASAWPLSPAVITAQTYSVGPETVVPRLIESILHAPPAVSDPDAPPAWATVGRATIAAMLTVGGAPGTPPPPHRDEPGARPGVRHRYRVASRAWQQWSPLTPTPARVRTVNTALVLLAEHELALSTLSARVAASARARPELCVVAGLSTLAGALHGQASVTLHRRLLSARTPGRSDSDASVGSGHVIHRADPRTALLLDALWRIAAPTDRRTIEELQRELAPAANVDLALAGLAFVARMPLGATTALFALARSAGWIAHVQEEYAEQPLRFRGHALS